MIGIVLAVDSVFWLLCFKSLLAFSVLERRGVVLVVCGCRGFVEFSCFYDLLVDAVDRLLFVPPLVRIDSDSLLVVGDVHGDFASVDAALRMVDRENIDVVVFLGDYVDRGPEQVEVLAGILEALVCRGYRVVLLRGNHETPSVNREYGFLDVLRSCFPGSWEELYVLANKLFGLLPYAAVANSILMLHGGVPRGVERVEDFGGFRKPLLDPEPGTPEFEVLWNDPGEYVSGFLPGVRGPGTYIFGKDVTEKLLASSGLRLLVRGHEVPGSRGYQYSHNGLVLTLYSCRYDGVRPVALHVLGDGWNVVWLDEVFESK